MSKLIYSQTSALMEGTYDGIKSRDQAVNPVYYSVAFTGDGFLYTHGRKFRLFNVVEDHIQGLSLLISKGIASITIDSTVVGNSYEVVQSVSGDSIVDASTSNGAVTLSHAEFLTNDQAAKYGSATQIPIITVNKSGHITAIQNSNTIDISKIRAEATTTTGQYHPVGVTDNTLQNPLYQNNFYFDGSGNVYGTNFYIGSKSLSDLFAPKDHVNAQASSQSYGHVLLFDSADSNKGASEHYAATPKAVDAAITSANQYSKDLFAAQDAMVFVGTIMANGTITSHNNKVATGVTDNTTTLDQLDYKVGWTLRFITSGTYRGEDVEVGDMIIAVKEKGAQFSINDWTIIQTNISGALTATTNLNGLLYANNSRVVNALALENGILKYNKGTLAFVDPNTTWRDIQINSKSIGTNVLNLLQGNNITISTDNGQVTISANTSGIISNSSYLNIEQGQVKFRYKPNAEATLTIGNPLSLTVDNNQYTLSHATGAQFTNKFGSITTDAYGHITGITDVTTLANPYSLTFKDNNGKFLEYSGSAAKVLVFANGTDISFTASTNANQETVITPSITHRYRAVQFYANSTSESFTPLLANNVNTALTIVGGNNVSISTKNAAGEDLPQGTIKINAEDTWRNILAYKFQSNRLSRSSIEDNSLSFGDDFLWGDSELGIMWTEIDDNGNVQYVK